MKILGKNSLSAGVKVGLKVILAIVIILESALIAFSIITKANIIEEPKNIILYLFMVTAIPAVIVVYNFIKIFKTFEEDDAFNRKNIKRLKIIWASFIIAGILFIAISILFKFLIGDDLLEDLYIRTYAQLSSMFIAFIGLIFVVLGIGIIMLLEIYKEAIRHKEENDLTI